MRPILACTLLFAAFTNNACRTMKPVSLEQLNVLRPDYAWVTESDQSVVLVDEPEVRGDTLVGYIGRQRAKLPSAGIQQLRVRAPATTRTALLAAGLVAGFGGVLFAVSGDGPSHVQTPVNGGSGDCLKHPEQPGCNGN